MRDVIANGIKYLGMTEFKGKDHNPIVVGFAKKIGIDWIKTDETPWCATAANFLLKESGREYLSSARAKDSLTLGIGIKSPVYGCLCVFNRGTNTANGHVGFYAGEVSNATGEFILVFGFNQNDSCSFKPIPKSDLVEYRFCRKREEIETWENL